MSLLAVRIHRRDSSMPLPKYETSGAADLISPRPRHDGGPWCGRARADWARDRGRQVFPRRVRAQQHAPGRGLMVANGVGVVDSDYCGLEDGSN
jgi:dUTPase